MMAKKLLFTTTAAIAAAALAPKTIAPVHADEVTSTTPAPTTENTSTVATESTETLKPQVDQAQTNVDAATKDVKTAEANNNQAQADLEAAQKTADEANPSLIQDIKADINASTTAKTEVETTVTNAEKKVADQTEITKAAETEKNNAATEKNTTDQAVKDAQTNLAAAEQAANPSAQINAENAVRNAQTEVIDAKTAVSNAEKAVTDATKHDATLADQLKEAQADSDAKKTALDAAQADLNTKQTEADTATKDVTNARDELKKLEDASKVNTGEFDNFHLNFTDPNTGETLFQLREKLRNRAQELDNKASELYPNDLNKQNQWYKANGEQELNTIRKQIVSLSAANSEYHATEADKNRPLDLANITDAQQREFSEFAAYLLHLYNQANNQANRKAAEKLGQTYRDHFYINTYDETINIALEQVEKYKKRALERGIPVDAGHIGGSFAENLAGLYPANQLPRTMGEAKELIAKQISFMIYRDFNAEMPVQMMHMKIFLDGPSAVAVGIVYVPKTDKLPYGTFGVTYIGTNEPGYKLGDYAPTYSDADAPLRAANPHRYIMNTNAPTAEQLKAAQDNLATATAKESTAKVNLAIAKANVNAAQTAYTAAQNKLADLSKDNKQAEIATANLRIAQNALAQAEKKLMDAQDTLKAVSSSKEEKAKALETARTNLATALATSQIAAQKLADATTKFETESAKLASNQAELTTAKAALAKLNETIANLTDKVNKLENAKENLAAATARATETATALTDAQKALKDANDKLADLTTRYNKAKELEDLAKTLDLTKDKDGNVISGKPNTAPTQDELPEFDPSQLKPDQPVTPKPSKPVDDTKPINNKPADKPVDHKPTDKTPVNYNPTTAPTVAPVVTNPTAATPVTTTANNVTAPTRATRTSARTLPNTGEQSSALTMIGSALLGTLAGTAFRRRRRISK